MSGVLERQRWLGGLALVVALPLPFTGIVSVPFLLPFAAAAALAVLWPRPLPPLRPWVENLLAPLILVLVVVAGGMRFGVLRPVAQLAVLLAAVRLPGCGNLARTARTGGLIGLIGVAGVASITHPILAVYLVALLALVIVAVGRMVMLAHAEASGSAVRPGWPPLRLVAATVVLATLVAAPLFVLLPRLRSPFASAPFGSRPVSGFREAVALHHLGDVKLSREIALDVVFPGRARPDPEWLRLSGATVQHYRAGAWTEGRRSRRLLDSGARVAVDLTERDPARPVHRAELVLRRNSEHLFLPIGTITVELPAEVPVWQDRLGTLTIPRRADTPIAYAVSFQPGRVLQPLPEPEDVALPAGSEAIGELARRIAGQARSRLAVALAVESHLQSAYTYSTSTFAPVRQDPVQWFLFSSRQGHCEFFASSMVMLLRALRIPARLQAGYVGGESDGSGGFLVRESQAHAWVVAWMGDGWRTFDPTPAEGRPGILGDGGGWDLALGWQRLEAAWDRWVLTFSLGDQVDLVRWVMDATRTTRHRWRRYVAPAALTLAVVVLLLLLRPRLPRLRIRRDTGLSGALERVSAAARGHGVVIDGAETPRTLERAIRTVAPAAGAPMRWLVSRHERWRYAGEEAPPRSEIVRARRAVVRAFAADRGRQG